MLLFIVKVEFDALSSSKTCNENMWINMVPRIDATILSKFQQNVGIASYLKNTGTKNTTRM